MIAQPEVGRYLAAMVYEATHGSPQGAQRDTALMTGPWAFDPAAITLPVRMWHGTEDRNATPGMGRYLERTIPSTELTWLAGEGHLSAPLGHGGAILADLRDRAE